MQVIVSAGAAIWLVGCSILVVYALISYLRLRRKVAASQLVFDNVYMSDAVKGPFILGVVRPRIYLPTGMAADTMECVLEHEKTHLKRGDHYWKPLGFLILTIYWFQPLCWIAYLLFCKDIELACDERVIKDKNNRWKAAYCQALLDCNQQKRAFVACPVAFGEVSVRERVKMVLGYKKPAFWIIVAAVICSLVVVVCFMTSPKEKQLKTSLDLASIGCSDTQGDNACEIFFEKDMNQILIHSMNSEEMYVFRYLNNTVEQVPYESGRFVADTELVVLSEYIEADHTIFQSIEGYWTDVDGEKSLVWLESGSGLPIDLTIHIRNEKEESKDDIILPVF